MSIKATLNGLSGLHTYVHMFVIIIEEYCWDGGNGTSEELSLREWGDWKDVNTGLIWNSQN